MTQMLWASCTLLVQSIKTETPSKAIPRTDSFLVGIYRLGNRPSRLVHGLDGWMSSSLRYIPGSDSSN